ncbi:MAG: molybdopterin-dependent oxidoreductase [Peptococcaceae bacterium]|nr:molybdopterin-dependent oxidoreductase [Peptococcaceae bacterium]
MVSRRDFIKSVAVGAAVASVGGVLPAGCKSDSSSSGGDSGSSTFKGVCRYCGTGCGVLVGVKDGKVTEIKGDPDCPVNGTRLCLKGTTLPTVFDADTRVKKPLILKSGKHVEAEWDEALDLIVQKFKEAIDTTGADSVGFYGSGQTVAEESYLANKLFKGCIGTNNIDGNPRTCMASAVAGFIATFGKDEPLGTYDDIEKANVFFIIGANMAEAHPILFERLQDHKKSNPDTKIIVLDPRKTQTTTIADKIVQFVPGSDLALLNSIAYVLIQKDLIDKDFMDKHTKFEKTVPAPTPENPNATKNEDLTFDEYKEFLEDYAPEKVAEKTGIAADEIVEIAEMFGEKGKNTMSLWTMGINQRSRGTWANNLIHNLHLLTGKICKPGNTPFSLTGQPSACGSIREVGALSHLLPGGRLVANEDHRKKIEQVWGIPEGTIKPAPGRHTINLFKGCVSGDIKVLWVMCTNPGQSLPNLNELRKGMQDVFLIVSDSFHPTRTTELADVILPSAFWMEKEGVYGNGERRTQHIAKAIDPPGDAKPDVWQIAEVAKRLGYEKEFAFAYNDKNDVDNELIWEDYRLCCDASSKMELASYKALKEAHGLTWPVTDKNPNGTKIRYGGDDPYVTGDIEFYAKPDKKAVIFARPQQDPQEMPDDEYPFFLSTGRVLEHWHTYTMTGKVPSLVKAYPDCELEINEKDAENLGVKTGDLVKITSRRGDVTVKAIVSGTKGIKGEPREKMVWIAFHDDRVDKMINLVTNDAIDNMSSQPEYKICAVKLEKV